MTAFVPFPKIARLNREVIASEKIDGTNACIQIADEGATMLVGSRTRWITPEDDNFGFARWAREHEAELLKLGPGTHFGEWWGAGIQRGHPAVPRNCELRRGSRGLFLEPRDDGRAPARI